MVLDDAAFEAALEIRWQAKRAIEPEFWQSERYNTASQPVVGVCWYEARLLQLAERPDGPGVPADDRSGVGSSSARARGADGRSGRWEVDG